MKQPGRNFWLLLALALPVLVLGGNILRHQFDLRGAQEWHIPISGYDPRDPLRGRYIRFSYDWTLTGDAAACRQGQCELCLDKKDGQVVARVRSGGEECGSRVDVAASNIAVPLGWRLPDMRFTSRIFVSEKSAPRLEAQMRDRPMQVVALLDRNGRLVSQRLELR